MATSKMTREQSISVSGRDVIEDDGFFDFGDPEIVPVEISPGKYLTLREPTANDLIEISKLSANKNISEVEGTLQTICILHVPDAGGRKLTFKDAKRLTTKQLRKLGEAVNELLGMDDLVDQEGEEK